LLHLALRFAAKRPLNTISCVFIHYKINFYAITLHSLSSVNKPSRELNICAQVELLMNLRAVFVLNFYQKYLHFTRVKRLSFLVSIS